MDDSLLNPMLADNIRAAHAELNIKKMDAIKSICKSHGYIFDERDRRFSQMLCIKDGDTEHYYFDNGTINGHYIAGFKLSQEIDKANPFTMNISYHIIVEEPENLKIKPQEIHGSYIPIHNISLRT